MSRRLLVLSLVGFAALAVLALAGFGASGASFTTMSDTWATASVDRASSWVHVYSRASDPDAADRAGYANQYGVSPATACASGQDEAIAITMGRFPAWTSATYAFTRVITLKTPAVFGDPAVTQVNVSVTAQADEDTGRQPLQNVLLAPIGSAGGAATVALAANQKVQLNLQVRTNWLWYWFYGGTYRPHVRLELSFPGAPDDYYVYDYPVLVTIA